MVPLGQKFITLMRYCFVKIKNALRIVLSTVSSAASRHCRYIEPMISFQTDFYLRVFLRVWKGKKECAQSGTKIGNVYNCNSCGNYEYNAFFQ
jgi:tRNA (guanine26-N2/guanine27-N2)-dimethyltransferase